MVDIISTPKDYVASELRKLEKTTDITEKQAILENLYDSALIKGEQKKSDEFKKNWREKTSKFIYRWFIGFNVVVLAIVVIAFALDICDPSRKLFTSTVLVSLIGATIVQTAAVFLLLTRYSIGLNPE